MPIKIIHMNASRAASSVQVKGLLKMVLEMIPAMTIRNSSTNNSIMHHRSKLSLILRRMSFMPLLLLITGYWELVYRQKNKHALIYQRSDSFQPNGQRTRSTMGTVLS